MARAVRARFSKGKIEPLERLDLNEGEEVLVPVQRSGKARESLTEAIEATAGAWEGLVDADQLKRDIYASRQLSTRPEPRL